MKNFIEYWNVRQFEVTISSQAGFITFRFDNLDILLREVKRSGKLVNSFIYFLRSLTADWQTICLIYSYIAILYWKLIIE